MNSLESWVFSKWTGSKTTDSSGNLHTHEIIAESRELFSIATKQSVINNKTGLISKCSHLSDDERLQGAEITAFTSSETRAHSTCLGWTPRADVHSRVEVGGYGQNRTALTLWAMASSCCSAHSCCWALSSALYSASLGSSCSQRLRAFCTAVSTYRRWQERGIARVKLQKLWPHTCFTLCLPALQPHWLHTKQKQQSFFLNSYPVPCKEQSRKWGSASDGQCSHQKRHTKYYQSFPTKYYLSW